MAPTCYGAGPGLLAITKRFARIEDPQIFPSLCDLSKTLFLKKKSHFVFFLKFSVKENGFPTFKGDVFCYILGPVSNESVNICVKDLLFFWQKNY